MHLDLDLDCFFFLTSFASPPPSQLSYAVTSASSSGASSGLTLVAAIALFAIDPANQGLLTVASTTQFSVIPVGTAISLGITASDASGLTASATLTLAVAIGNLPPVLSPGQARSVLENAAVGTPIGAPLAASDSSGLPLTYSLAPTAAYADAASWVSVDPPTGQLRVARAGLDYESPVQPWSFPNLVTVSNGVMSGSDTVMVSVLDVNEAPLCTLPNGTVFRVDENTAGLPLATVSCWGVDASISLTFAVWKVRCSAGSKSGAARHPLDHSSCSCVSTVLPPCA